MQKRGQTQSVSRSIKVGQGRCRFELPLQLTQHTLPHTVTVSLVTTSGRTVCQDTIPCGAIDRSETCWVVGWVDDRIRPLIHNLNVIEKNRFQELFCDTSGLFWVITTMHFLMATTIYVYLAISFDAIVKRQPTG